MFVRARVLEPRDVRRIDEEIPEGWITWPEAPRNPTPCIEKREPHNEHMEMA